MDLRHLSMSPSEEKSPAAAAIRKARGGFLLSQRRDTAFRYTNIYVVWGDFGTQGVKRISRKAF